MTIEKRNNMDLLKQLKNKNLFDDEPIKEDEPVKKEPVKVEPLERADPEEYQKRVLGKFPPVDPSHGKPKKIRAGQRIHRKTEPGTILETMAPGAGKPEGTRMIRLQCPNNRCKAIFRMSQKWVDKIPSSTLCIVCGDCIKKSKLIGE